MDQNDKIRYLKMALQLSDDEAVIQHAIDYLYQNHFKAPEYFPDGETDQSFERVIHQAEW